MGYAWVSTCDQYKCSTIINRGLSYCCGGMHEGEDLHSHDGELCFTSCGGYFCEKHLETAIGFGSSGSEKVLSVCAGCAEQIKLNIGNYDEWPNSYVTSKGRDVVVAEEIAE